MLEIITRCQSREVIFVTEQYFERSIKGGERDKRASSVQIRITARRAAHKQFKNIFQFELIKQTELLQVLSNEWQDQRHIAIIGGFLLGLGIKAVIEVIEREIIKQRVTELCSNQEETDKKCSFRQNS